VVTPLGGFDDGRGGNGAGFLGFFAAAALISLTAARGHSGHARHELTPKLLLDSPEAFDAFGEPELEHGFGVRVRKIGRKLLLQLGEQFVLHGLDIGKAEKGPGFLRGAVDIDGDFHDIRNPSDP